MYRSAFRFPTRAAASLLGRAGRVAERPITTVVLPSLSPTMETGVISEWKKAAGDVVRAGDILCDIDTDKASVGYEVSNSSCSCSSSCCCSCSRDYMKYGV
jgi:hypothetical protein